MRFVPFFLAACFFFCFFSAADAAQQLTPVSGNDSSEPSPSNKKQPVEIEASQQLEWLRDKNMYRATGDVMIKQGDTTITGDTAEAAYDPDEGASALTLITVTDHVVITNLGRVIHADKAVYDTRTQLLTLTGDTITLTSPDMDVVAHDSMEYNAAENKATASGKAEIRNATQNLKAETITAWLEKKTNKLQRATAKTNVFITRKNPDGTDTAQANDAVYDAVKNTVDLNGNVKLTRGTNHMQGDHAIVDMTTGVATLKSSATSDAKTPRRVRAIFTPGDSKTPLPSVTASMPMVAGKKEYQPAAVNVVDASDGAGENP